MNLQEKDILMYLKNNGYRNQREMVEKTNHSLGIVNKSLKQLVQEGYLSKEFNLTEKSSCFFKENKTKNAIILAAGYGMRIVSRNEEKLKGLLEINDEPLIERLIKQLYEVGITSVYVVVGFMKEKYEYLIDEYGVKLIVSREYSTKNNLHSLKLAVGHLQNCYILPCDLWFKENPFRQYELYSWYMVSDEEDEFSSIRVNRKMELVESEGGNYMIGLCYLDSEISQYVGDKILNLSKNKRYNGSFWEEALFEKNKMIIPAKMISSNLYKEINTYEQYLLANNNVLNKRKDAFKWAKEELTSSDTDIKDITLLKSGVTNDTYSFVLGNTSYVLKITNDNSSVLLNKENEVIILQELKKYNMCEEIISINSEKGYKLSFYMEDVKCCDPYNEKDLKMCIKSIKKIHNIKIENIKNIDLFDRILKFEKAWNQEQSAFKDYQNVKNNVFSLKNYIESCDINQKLTHLDLSPSNFLIKDDEAHIINWDYAGMQDPLVDLALFAIQANYDKNQIDHLVGLYSDFKCDQFIYKRIYAYISICGLMWSNWCEYYRQKGIEFGEYSLQQYRYAKNYFKYFTEF